MEYLNGTIQADNTAYTLRAYALALRDIAPSVATSYMPGTLYEIGCLESGKRYHWQNILRRDDKND